MESPFILTFLNLPLVYSYKSNIPEEQVSDFHLDSHSDNVDMIKSAVMMSKINQFSLHTHGEILVDFQE